MRDIPTLDRLSSIRADGSRKNIQPADAIGRWTRWRTIVFTVLIAVYLLLPFVEVGGHPAVQLDVMARRFYLFGGVFNAQDFWRAIFLLLTVGISLFFVTTWLGRAWCGWACPQTVFLEGVFRRIERWVEGPREKRMRLDAAPWTLRKIGLRLTTHGAYLAVSLVLANVALAFFVSLPTTWSMVCHSPTENWTPFLWVMAFTGAMYFNFAWFREQLCVVVCPYGRLQSVLLDRDSLIIGYDVARGEPRGKLKRSAVSLPVMKTPPPRPAPAPAEVPSLALGFAALESTPGGMVHTPPPPLGEGLVGAGRSQGDCIDCLRCVTVCPTGIDIRNGTQLECVACARCIDACDDVMRKIGKPEGLIRYDSQGGLETGERRTMRPRLLLYGVLLVASIVGLTIATMTRTLFEANVLRTRGLPYIVDASGLRNSYELHLVNKNPEKSTLHIAVTAPIPVEVKLPTPDVTLAPLEHYRAPIVVVADPGVFRKKVDVTIEVRDDVSGQAKTLTVPFLGPAK